MLYGYCFGTLYLYRVENDPRSIRAGAFAVDFMVDLMELSESNRGRLEVDLRLMLGRSGADLGSIGDRCGVELRVASGSIHTLFRVAAG